MIGDGVARLELLVTNSNYLPHVHKATLYATVDWASYECPPIFQEIPADLKVMGLAYNIIMHV